MLGQTRHMDEAPLPLFVLPMVLFPGEIQELRVFEPRYRQMLDTCILDERPFGLVMNDPFSPVKGWDGPRRHGCEATIVHHETKGLNHFITVEGGRRFFIDEVVEPALPPFSDPTMADLMEDGVAPDVHSLLERVPANSPTFNLFMSAKVTYLDELRPLTEDEQSELAQFAVSIIHRVGEQMNVEATILHDWAETFCEQNINETPESLFNIAALSFDQLEPRQQLLASTTTEEAMHELRTHLQPPPVAEE